MIATPIYVQACLYTMLTALTVFIVWGVFCLIASAYMDTFKKGDRS